MPESYFRVPDESAWADRWQLDRSADGSFDYREFLRAATEAGRSSNGVFGARVMWGTIDELVSRLRDLGAEFSGTDLDVLTAALGPTRFVHLLRADVVAQAVSWARAEQTGFWQDGDPLVPDRVPTFDPEQIGSWVRTIHEHNRAWTAWFAGQGIQPHQVGYEELVADMTGVTRGILDFLGLDQSAADPIAPRHVRQADRINEEWIDRYPESRS